MSFMNSIDVLKQLLGEQYGTYIRNTEYHQAFLDAMDLLSTTKIPNSSTGQTDILYLYLHRLIVELFQKITKLEKQILMKKSVNEAKP